MYQDDEDQYQKISYSKAENENLSDNFQSFQNNFETSHYDVEETVQMFAEEVYEANNDFSCEICRKKFQVVNSFRSEFYLNEHISVVHEGRKIHVCTICPDNPIFQKPGTLLKHHTKLHESDIGEY